MRDSPGVAENIASVRKRIGAAARRVGRNWDEVKLVAVVKQASVEQIREAISAGITDLGENRAQDLLERMPQLPLDVLWHFVGHLQTNKVKQIIRFVELIHSVDRLSLVEEISKRAAEIEKQQQVLIQVNTAGETSKFGLEPQETIPFLEAIREYRFLKPRGLMTIAPLVHDQEEVRPVFAALRRLLEEVVQAGIVDSDFNCLSMGMSNDFEVAVEEGSNMVRIGTSIFGVS
jgi:pyridoxal phosphate enzyme (YggS family)